MKPDLPAGYSQTPSDHQRSRRRRRARAKHPVKDTAVTSASQLRCTPDSVPEPWPTAKTSRSRGRTRSDIGLTVKTACGPRRSKRNPCQKGLFLSTHGSSNAPRVSHANTLSPREGRCKPSLSSRVTQAPEVEWLWVLGCVVVGRQHAPPAMRHSSPASRPARSAGYAAQPLRGHHHRQPLRGFTSASA